MKDIFLSDISRNIPPKEYLTLLSRSQYIIIKTWRNKPGNVSVRALEAMASKTIPLIFTDNELQSQYRMLGFNKSNCYFIEVEGTEENVLVHKYNKKIAKAGYKLVCEKHTWVKRAEKILEETANRAIFPPENRK